MARPEDKTVLIVEDEPDVLLFLQSALEDEGFNVKRSGAPMGLSQGSVIVSVVH